MTALTDFPTSSAPTRVCNRLGYTVRTSRNLRGVLEHARRHNVDVVELRELEAGHYGVAFHFDNGDTALTNWADWRVLLDWILSRRSWSVTRVSVDASLFPVVDAHTSTTAIRKTGTLVHIRGKV